MYRGEGHKYLLSGDNNKGRPTRLVRWGTRRASVGPAAPEQARGYPPPASVTASAQSVPRPAQTGTVRDPACMQAGAAHWTRLQDSKSPRGVSSSFDCRSVIRQSSSSSLTSKTPCSAPGKLSSASNLVAAPTNHHKEPHRTTKIAKSDGMQSQPGTEH